MADSDTLLAYLVSSFPGNTENIATEALAHILSSSDAAKEALNDVIQSGVRDINPVQTIKTQQGDKDGTRPDLVGFDEYNKERVLIEVKFWAGLTSNQPNGYLERLSDDSSAVLIFLTPDERIKTLWPELRDRILRKGEHLREIDSERKCVRVGTLEKYLLVVSWTGLLDAMAARVTDANEPARVENDIRQLRNLARYADAGAVLPVRKGEEFGTDSDRRERDYRRLIDDATQRGRDEDWISTKGLNRTPRSYGYGRYMFLGGKAVWFGINKQKFEETGETPLWLQITYWERYASKFSSFGVTDSWVPVSLPRDVEYPSMLEGVVDSLQDVAKRFESIMKEP